MVVAFVVLLEGVMQEGRRRGGRGGRREGGRMGRRRVRRENFP